MYSTKKYQIKNLKKKIPVIHKEIQPIIHEEIQPVVVKEIQQIIDRRIQPVIFPETQSIEEVIQQLQQLKQTNGEGQISLEGPNYGKEDIVESNIQPYIQREEKHITQRKVESICQREVKNITQIYMFLIYNAKMEVFFLMHKKIVEII